MYLLFVSSLLATYLIRSIRERMVRIQRPSSLLATQCTPLRERLAKRRGRRRSFTKHQVGKLLQELNALPAGRSFTWRELGWRVGATKVHEGTIRHRMKKLGYRRDRRGVFYHRRKGPNECYIERIVNSRFANIITPKPRTEHDSVLRLASSDGLL